MAVAILGAIALSLVSQAKAESGEGNGILPPGNSEIEASQNAAPAQEAEDKSPAKKPAKAAVKTPVEQGAKPAAPAREEASADAAVSETASAEAGQDNIPSIEVTSAILSGQSDARLRLKPVDVTRADTIRPMIARHASENGVPFALVDAVVRIESRYNPVARNGVNVGLTQINVRTAQSLGYQGGAAGLFDAETNLRYGVKYLAQAYKLARGDTCGTILRYQAGHRAETMTRASRTYCGKVKTLIGASS
ncbi:lytic transglycosylase domain-containing protein [Microvirga terricola]|uniref:Lytic transglycosylase domain-containing protein n=1 Tax=Microvirga terricola TaxID=2719797 RepID=A0ABX0VBG9_9HYPH|nr:lytic transglycosylase domain-containing protein [Microvirga terricola]NIX76416.1 lytic transglycosylase domain-containing protein [Microvirga terricola]